MKVLWSWLLELCDLPNVPTAEEGARALTRAGLEIEGLANLGAGFSGVVVAQVVAKRPHPQADKLTLVDVITAPGGAATQVVCGAPNVPEPGRKVLWAQIGATLPGGITLAEKPVKGIVSPGMLCAEDELGLSEDHAGIVVLAEDDTTPLGAPAQRALGVDDWLLELNAPANRGDVLGHLGVARELAGLLRGTLVLPELVDEPGGDGGLAIAIADPALCPRYTGRLLSGVRVASSAASGAFGRRMAQRLRAVGVRSISNVVDVTNYVLFELGQPLHAFDADKLGATVGVGAAADAERIVTLDGVERVLTAGDIVIRDGANGAAAALGGVMGGRDTEVTDGTTRILLESASFAALRVRRTAKRLGLHSEASHRFERGVDPELAALASARAAKLFSLVAGASAGAMVDAYPGKREPSSITVRLPRVRMLSGVALEAATCADALQRLGFMVAQPGAAQPGGAGSGELLAVTPPSARADVTREADVIEEVLRVVGYEHVPSTLPVMRQAPGVQPRDRGDAARLALSAAGAAEAITFGFQSVARAMSLGLPPGDRRAQPIGVRNPMSADQAVMRTSLLPNLLAAVARNASFGRPDVALFEVGSVFLRRGEGLTEQPLHELADEPTHAAGVLAGRRPAQFGAGTPWDVFDAKALALEAIRAVSGPVAVAVSVPEPAVPFLHPGVQGALAVDGRRVGWFGEVHPDVRARLGLDAGAPVFTFGLDLSLLPLAGPSQMTAIPRFPGSTRDVSLLLAAQIPAAQVAAIIAAAAEPLVAGVRCLEDYRDDAKLGAGQKSMLWSIAYRAPDRTLTDAELDAAHEAIVARLVRDLPAQRR